MPCFFPTYIRCAPWHAWVGLRGYWRTDGLKDKRPFPPHSCLLPSHALSLSQWLLVLESFYGALCLWRQHDSWIRSVLPQTPSSPELFIPPREAGGRGLLVPWCFIVCFQMISDGRSLLPQAFWATDMGDIRSLVCSVETQCSEENKRVINSRSLIKQGLLSGAVYMCVGGENAKVFRSHSSIKLDPRRN